MNGRPSDALPLTVRAGKIYFAIVLGLGPALVLLAGLLGTLPVCSARAAQAPQDDRTPLAHLLDPDGTLNLSGGFSGALDPAGWRMEYGAGGTPIFKPANELAASLSPGKAWHALGSGLNSFVYAVAVAGAGVYVGGRFTDAGGDPSADYIARWGPLVWHVCLPLVLRNY